MKFCVHCGKQINDVATFCPYCGKAVQKESDAKNPDEVVSSFEEASQLIKKVGNKKAKKKSRRVGKLVLLCLLIVGIGISGVMIVSKVFEFGKKEQYKKRIDVYREYYKQVKKEYKGYMVTGTITLDKDSLPLLWMCIAESSDWDARGTTQLVSVKRGDAEVLAERGKVILPIRGNAIMGIDNNNDNKVYLYNESKEDFVLVTDALKGKGADNLVEIYSEDELEKKLEQMEEILGCVYSMRGMQIGVHEPTKRASYFGLSYPDIRYEALCQLGVFYPVSVGEGNDKVEGFFLREAYSDNRMIRKIYEQYQNIDMSEKQIKSYLKDYKRIMYGTKVKVSPENVFLLPDGSECQAEEGKKKENSIKIMLRETKWELESGEAAEYLDEIMLERLMRELEKKPVYSNNELYLKLIAIVHDCEIVNVNIDKYFLQTASKDVVINIIEDYFNFNCGSDMSFFSDDLAKNHWEFMNTSPQGHDSYELRGYENQIVTFGCENGEEYQYRIGFSEDGSVINKIEYIDPYASLPNWKRVYLNGLDMSEIWYPTLIDVNKDGVPELISCLEESGAGSCWYMHYIDKSDEIHSFSAGFNGSLSYNQGGKKIYVSGVDGSGGIYERVFTYNTKNGVYDLSFEGMETCNYDDYSTTYEINQEEVSEQEYSRKVKRATTNFKNVFESEALPEEDVEMLIINYK